MRQIDVKMVGYNRKKGEIDRGNNSKNGTNKMIQYKKAYRGKNRKIQ